MQLCKHVNKQDAELTCFLLGSLICLVFSYKDLFFYIFEDYSEIHKVYGFVLIMVSYFASMESGLMRSYLHEFGISITNR